MYFYLQLHLHSHGSRSASLQFTYDVTSFGVDAVDFLETDAAYAGLVVYYRVRPPLRVSNATLADCAALAATGWGAALNWVIPSSTSPWCCNATGITCGGPDGRVTEIRLATNQLTGMRQLAVMCSLFDVWCTGDAFRIPM